MAFWANVRPWSNIARSLRDANSDMVRSPAAARQGECRLEWRSREVNKDNAVAAPAARLFAAAFASFSVLLFPATALAQSADDIRDGKVCASCHADAPLIWGGKHGTKADSRTPIAIVGCATCHGDPSEHLKSGSPMPNRFSKMSAHDKNEVCQSCHQGRERMHWPGSTHERNDVSCSSCHK